ncbi:MAG: hypothetical protein V3V29_09370 [Acidimicrobiia bacterium]
MTVRGDGTIDAEVFPDPVSAKVNIPSAEVVVAPSGESSTASLRRGRGQLAWRLKEWERLKNRRGSDPVLIDFGKAILADFAEIKQALARLGLLDSASDLLANPPDWTQWVKTERTQLPLRLEAAIEEIDLLIAENT